MIVPFVFGRLIVISGVNQTKALKLSHLKRELRKNLPGSRHDGTPEWVLAINIACDVLSSFAQASFLISLYHGHTVPFKQPPGKGR